MLAAPEAAAWAAHPAARTGKLEKRGRLKDEWKAMTPRRVIATDRGRAAAEGRHRLGRRRWFGGGPAVGQQRQ